LNPFEASRDEPGERRQAPQQE